MLLLPELMGNRTKDASANQLAFVVHKDYSIVVELDLAAIVASTLHCSADDHTVDHVSFLDLTTRLRFLDRSNDGVAQPCSFLPLQGLYAHNPLGTRVVHHLEVGSHLDECSDLLEMQKKNLSCKTSISSLRAFTLRHKHFKKTRCSSR
jgi:hypothetical protein